MSYTPPAGNAAGFDFSAHSGYTPSAGNAAGFDFEATAGVSGYASAPSPLGAPAVLAASVRQAWAAAPSPLGSPAVFGSLVYGRADAPSMLGAPAVVAGHVFGWASAPSPLGVPVVLGGVGAVDPLAWASAPSPLGAPAAVAVQVYLAHASAPSMLGAPAVLATPVVVARAAVPGPLAAPAVTAWVPILATAAAPSMLGACGVLAYHDFTAGLGEVVTRYVLDLVTPGGLVRVPMSSWQATLQTGRSNYVQAVVPAVAGWVDTINAATEFVVSRVAVLPGGSVLEYEMARSPLEQTAFNRGPQRFTCTLSGYSTGFDVTADPPAVYDRELAGVRSISSGTSGMRVRCAVDWLLRPGHRAFADGSPFVVAYINYYVQMNDGGGGDAYMDAGERN